MLAMVWPSPDNPTAVHFVADVHDTPRRLLLGGPLGLGVVWIVQLVPSQRSANVPPLPMLGPDSPTAVHAVADVHETAFRLPPLGVVWVVQVLPSQRSASPPDPTAMHAVADVHETPFRLTPLGVAWIVQVLPFHRSASVTWLLLSSPTAVHAVADVHDTPFSRLTVVPLAVGVVWIVQVLPSHRSASGLLLLPLM